MATTSPDSIYSPGRGDLDRPSVYLLQMAESIQTALKKLSPIGEIRAYAGASAPSGFILCNGQAVSRSTYSALFGVIGTTYGAGDNSTTFNLPDLRGRVLVHRDASVYHFESLGKEGGQITSHHNHWTGVGGTGGEIFHRSATDLPRSRVASGWRASVDGAWTQSSYRENSTHDEATSHLQPYTVINYMIRAT